MLTTNVEFKNFKKNRKKSKVVKIFKDIKDSLDHKSDLFLSSLTSKYKYSFDNTKLSRLKRYPEFTIIGMGGSSLGAKAIYSFLKLKINFVSIELFA